MKTKVGLTLFVLTLICIVYGCKKNALGDTSPDADAPKIEKSLPVAGGMISLPNVVNIQFSANSFSQDVNVTVIQSTKDNELIQYLNDVTSFYGIDKKLEYFIRVNTTSNPKKDVTFKIKVTDELLNSLKPGYAFEVLALLNQSVDEDIFSFDVVRSKFSSSTKELEVTLPYYYFDMKDDGKRYEAVLTIATILGNLKAGRQTANGDCGFYVRCPLNSCDRVTSPFNPMRPHPTRKNPDGTPLIAPHKGVDFAASTNSPVYAAYDGTVVGTDEMKGYGNIITLSHINNVGQRIATRYAHLNAFKVIKGQVVKEGDLIGLSGMTGGVSSGPHLHFEYFVNGNTGDFSGVVDPAPFINTTSIRLLSAEAELTGVNNCYNNRVNNNGSTWLVTFDYKDPLNKITPKATLTFQDIEPVTNTPYVTTIGSLKTANGLVESPGFCAYFSGANYFKVRVYLTLENGVKSNCIVFVLNRVDGAPRVASTQDQSVVGSGSSSNSIQ